MEPKKKKAAPPEHAYSHAAKSRWFADLRTTRVAPVERLARAPAAAVEDSAEESDLPFTD